MLTVGRQTNLRQTTWIRITRTNGFNKAYIYIYTVYIYIIYIYVYVYIYMYIYIYMYVSLLL